MKSMLKAAVAFVLLLTLPVAAGATDEKPIVPLKIQVTIARYQGDKKVSSLPYAVTVNTGARGMLRMGSQVPIPMAAGVPKEVPQGMQYRDVGINIDCTNVVAMDDGRYRFDMSIDDSSLYGEDAPRTGQVLGAPSFRQFRLMEQMVLKDGQSREFVAATDKVNGEVTRVEVTLTVVK